MSASAARSTSTPSTFATLLRRSKFASYDPQIGQVYATHGGYAHRGDYGLKRPLSLRRRDARITVKNIDSRHQQTEWRSAYLDAKFMKKQEETGCSVTLHDPIFHGRGSSWASNLGPSSGDLGPWHVYSEYALGPSKEGKAAEEVRGEEEARLAVETAGLQVMPNLRSMTESQFNSYAKKTRKLYSEHQNHIQQLAQRTRHTDETSNSTRRLNEGNYVRFLVNEHSKRSSKSSSSFIRPLPHANAGLEYTHAPNMQQYFFTKPLPGRRLVFHQSYRQRADSQVISMGGWIGHEFMRASESTSITDFGTAEGSPRMDRNKGKGMFRLSEQHLVDPPKVVSKAPQTMQDAQLSRLIMTHEGWEEKRNRLNPHMPGSREYVAHIENASPIEQARTPPKPIITRPPTYTRRTKDDETPAMSGQGILNNILNMLERTQLNKKESEGGEQ
ncbi:hypothetical protein SCHPADRAFT_935469 [Schizopora paradoxa]|uniref:Uncharacterized protein n=1 Tax=Schizopora paradoxa TaxID=27342 RepID=A0A0H2S5B4_9AGAM|nr:hypothetical protein SCHPADRAFT_935469 [Schizopora paradoxa]